MEKQSITEHGLPETDKEWEDFFNANHWRGSENTNEEHATAGDYAADPLTSHPDHAHYKAPSRATGENDQTICADCASYMANGEGDPDHENRFAQGARDLEQRGINLNNLAFNDMDEDGNRIPPSDDKCFICGQDVDPDTENFGSPYGQPGSRMHLFQPGERGYHNFGRTARVVGAVSRQADSIWR